MASGYTPKSAGPVWLPACVTPANMHELSALPELVERTRGGVVGGRNYWSPKVREEPGERGLELLATYRTKSDDPRPTRSTFFNRPRYRIDTVFSQGTGRYSIKQVWAKDLWHLAGKLLRKALSHASSF